MAAPQPTAQRPQRDAQPGTSEQAPARQRSGRSSSRLSSWEARELESLPDTIAEVESQQAALTAQLSDPALYQQNPDRLGEINDELAALETRLGELFDRWEKLEAKRAND